MQTCTSTDLRLRKLPYIPYRREQRQDHPSPIRRLLFQAQENTRGIWEIAEIEIYGRGFAPFASYVTNLIDLGSPASLGQLQWSGYQDKGGRIDLSMRSGLDDDPNTFWRNTFRGSERTRFDQSGEHVSPRVRRRIQ